MDWMEFTASLVNSLAWPIAAVALGIAFRQELTHLARRITSGKVLGTEFTFAHGIEEVESARAEASEVAVVGNTTGAEGDHGAPDSAPPESTPPRHQTAWESGVRGWPADIPEYLAAEGLVLSTWKQVDLAARRAATTLTSHVGPVSKHHMTAAQAINALAKAGVIDQNTLRVFEGLRDLRDEVAHTGASPSDGQALAFAENAEWLVARLDAIMI